MHTESIRSISSARESNGELHTGSRATGNQLPASGSPLSSYPPNLSRRIAMDNLMEGYHSYARTDRSHKEESPAENEGRQSIVSRHAAGKTTGGISLQGKMPGKMNMLLRTFLSRTGHTGNSSHLSNLRHLGSSCMSTSNNLSPLPLNRKLNIQLQVRDFIFSTKHYPETQKQSSALPVMVKEKATPGGSPINTNVIEMKTMLLKTIVGESLFEESQQHGTANKTALNAQVETAVRNAATAIESVIRKSLREEWPDDDDAARFICLLIKAFNTFTFEHSERVIDLSVDLAREMGIDDEKQLKSIEEGARFHDLGEVELELQKASPDVRERISWYIGISDIRKCGFFHDIGKVKIPDSILNKPGRLTDEEFEIIKKHPVIGEQILSSIASLRDVLPVVRHHHERWDGKGYPDRLSGDNIPFEARIVSVADAYDAMVSDRPYRKGMSAEKAIEELEKCAGSQFDPLIVKAFMKVLKKRVRLL